MHVVQKVVQNCQFNLAEIQGEHDLANFRRAMRMNRPGDFSRVFRQGKRIGGGGLTILTVENTVGYPRLGLAIAKKHVKLASHRNRYKRMIRESFRQHQSAFSNIDIVVLSRQDLVRREQSQMWATLERHWLAVVAQWQKS
jgi:ribonuclease P protein component